MVMSPAAFVKSPAEVGRRVGYPENRSNHGPFARRAWNVGSISRKAVSLKTRSKLPGASRGLRISAIFSLRAQVVSLRPCGSSCPAPAPRPRRPAARNLPLPFRRLQRRCVIPSDLTCPRLVQPASGFQCPSSLVVHRPIRPSRSPSEHPASGVIRHCRFIAPSRTGFPGSVFFLIRRPSNTHPGSAAVPKAAQPPLNSTLLS